jgi:hypothetical protein
MLGAASCFGVQALPVFVANTPLDRKINGLGGLSFSETRSEGARPQYGPGFRSSTRRLLVLRRGVIPMQWGIDCCQSVSLRSRGTTSEKGPVR